MPSDCLFDDDLLAAAELVVVNQVKLGRKPKPEIFNRPILRSRALRETNNKVPWHSSAYVDAFPSVLCAVEELSFGSLRVRHVDPIDDILIANNIANSANGEKTESYNCLWSWQDTASEISKNLERQKSSESFLTFSGTGQRRSEKILARLACNVELCGADTTIAELPN